MITSLKTEADTPSKGFIKASLAIVAQAPLVAVVYVSFAISVSCVWTLDIDVYLLRAGDGRRHYRPFFA